MFQKDLKRKKNKQRRIPEIIEIDRLEILRMRNNQ